MGTGGSRPLQLTATLICVNSSGARPRAAVTFFQACARRHWNVVHRPPPPPTRALRPAMNSSAKLMVRFLILSMGSTG